MSANEHDDEQPDSFEVIERLRVELTGAREVLTEYDKVVDALRARVAQLEAALKQSVELQSHYAELLNMHDGGQRLTFANVEAWLDRLAALKDAPQ